jgi:deazaflavin-dependent oxidoreductase (nitroreductase family)
MVKLTDANPRSGIWRWVLRAPVYLYGVGFGWLLDGRFLLLRHVGRKTGLLRQTVLEVLRRDNQDGSYIVCSGWGEASQWYRNLLAQPEAEIELGTRWMKVTAKPLPQERAEQEIRDYSKVHPRAFRWLAGILVGTTAKGDAVDFAELARRAPMMALQLREQT